MTRNGIPTRRAGVQFRSRLEARWSLFFDLLGWPWEYEPLDLDGYIPDFVVLFPFAPLLIEVKPALSIAELHEWTPKIEDSGWQHDALIVGARLFASEYAGDGIAAGVLSQRGGTPNLSSDLVPHHEWMWDGGDLIRCSECTKPSVYHPIQGWWCYRCGAAGKIYWGDLKHGPVDFVGLWCEAGNQTQWHPPSRP